MILLWWKMCVFVRRVKLLYLEHCSLLTTGGLESVLLSWKGLQRLMVVSCSKIKDSEVTPELASLFSVLKELKWRPDTRSLLSADLEGIGMWRKGGKFFTSLKGWRSIITGEAGSKRFAGEQYCYWTMHVFLQLPRCKCSNSCTPWILKAYGLTCLSVIFILLLIETLKEYEAHQENKTYPSLGFLVPLLVILVYGWPSLCRLKLI